MKTKTYLVTLIIALISIIYSGPAFSETVSGQVEGSVSGTITYTGNDNVTKTTKSLDGSISGAWTYDSSSGMTVSGTLGTPELSCSFSGSYNLATQELTLTFVPPGGGSGTTVTFPLTTSTDNASGSDAYSFSGTVSGTAPSSTGNASYSANVSLKMGSASEQTSSSSGTMSGVWSGSSSVSYSGSATVAGQSIPINGSLPAVSTTGTWSGTWSATYNFTTGTLSGSFSGTFTGSGTATGLPYINSLTLSIQGSYSGAIETDASGAILFSGSWQECKTTNCTTGIHEGYGGDFPMTLSSEPEFPISISGTPSGGGSYTATIGSASLTVSYSFSGAYSGTVTKD